MLDESICHFRGVGPFCSFYSIFEWKILSANKVGPDQMPPRLASKYRWREFPVVITVLGNTPNFGKVGNTGKYEILELFELKYTAIFHKFKWIAHISYCLCTYNANEV